MGYKDHFILRDGEFFEKVIKIVACYDEEENYFIYLLFFSSTPILFLYYYFVLVFTAVIFN